MSHLKKLKSQVNGRYKAKLKIEVRGVPIPFFTNM